MKSTDLEDKAKETARLNRLLRETERHLKSLRRVHVTEPATVTIGGFYRLDATVQEVIDLLNSRITLIKFQLELL